MDYLKFMNLPVESKTELDLLNQTDTPNMIKLDLLIRLCSKQIISQSKARSVLETITEGYDSHFTKDDTDRLCYEYEKQYFKETIYNISKQKDLKEFLIDTAEELERLRKE